jgi:acetyl esterase/lipase
MSQDILELPAPPQGERIAYGAAAFQFGELRLPQGEGLHPVVIVIHGGFWRAAYDIEHISHLCVALNNVGFATWGLEYRRIGNPGGAWPGTFQDIAAGADHLRSIAAPYKLDLNRVIAAGHSAGGHLALWLAARSRMPENTVLYAAAPLPLRGVISLAGVADLQRAYELGLSNSAVGELLGGSPTSVPERYRCASPIELLPLHISQRIIHGALDTVVPIEISQRYATKAKASGDDVELITLQDTEHFELIDPRTKQFEVVRQTVAELLQ